MPKYTIRFKFSTARKGRGNSISGDTGTAECDIDAEIPLCVLEGHPDELKSVCAQSLEGNKKVARMGNIISVKILEILRN